MPYVAAIATYFGATAETAGAIATGVEVAGTAASLGGAALSYNASMQQAKQSKMNASAHAQAIAQEQARQAAETQAAQLRTVQNQRRFSATQQAQLSGNGFISSTGSPLDILADTHTAQQRDLNDIGYGNSVNQWQLGAQSQAALAEGNSQAGAIMGQAGGTLLSNAGYAGMSAYRSGGGSNNSYNAYGNSAIPVGYQPRSSSQRY